METTLLFGLVPINIYILTKNRNKIIIMNNSYKIINNMLPNINFYSGSALLANPPKSLHQSNKFDSAE